MTLRTRQDAPSRSAGIVGDRWWRAGIVFSAPLALSACAGEDVASGPGEGGETQQEMLTGVLEEARSDPRVSGEQIQTLERWLETDDTPHAEYIAAIDRAFACFADIGVPYGMIHDPQGGDYPDTNYSVQAQDRSTFEHCEYQDVFYVSMAYQLGDGVAATRAQRESELLPELRACLATLGYDIPAEATMAELLGEVPADASRAHTECRWGSG